MTDIAILGFRADTSDLVKGTKDLDAIGDASERAEQKAVQAGKGINKAGDQAAAGLRESATEARQSVSAYAANGAAAQSMAQQHQLAAGQVGNLTAQFNEIGMMLAAGQNPLQLALQQGTQITQVFGGMGAAGAVRGLGAAFMSMISPLNLMVIGGIAAGATAFQWLTSAGEEALTFEDRLSNLTDTLDRYRDYAEQAGLPTEELRDRFGESAEAARKFYEELERIEGRNLVRQSAGIAGGLMEGIVANDRINGDLIAERFGFDQIQFALPRSERGQERGRQRAMIDSYAGSIVAANSATNIDDQVTSMTQLLEVTKELADYRDGRSTSEDQVIGQLTKQLTILTQIQEATSEEAQARREAAEAVEKSVEFLSLSAKAAIARGAAETAANEKAREMLASLQSQAQIQSLIAEHGADSVQVAEARTAAERATYQETVSALGVSEDMQDALMRSWDAAQGVAETDMTSGISAAANEASRMAGEIERAVTGVMNLAAQSAVARRESEIKLRYAGDPIATARALAEERTDISSLDPLLQEGLADERAQAISDAEAAARNQAALADWRKAQTEAARTSKSAKSESQKEADRIKNEREREAAKVMKDVERSALDAMSATQRFNAELTDLHDLYKEGYLSAAEYGLAVNMLHDEMEQTQFEKVRQGIDGISDAMGQAILNGQSMGDALSSVFAKIAADMVASGITSMLAGAFRPGEGAGGFIADLLGGPVRSFDGGGYTGSGSRSGGLDGKGGFYGLLHPQETVVDHTKGQGASQEVRLSGGDMRLSDNGEIVATIRAEIVEGDRQVMGRVPSMTLKTLRDKGNQAVIKKVGRRHG